MASSENWSGNYNLTNYRFSDPRLSCLCSDELRKRYKSGDADWYKDQSRAPHSRPTALGEIDKQRIISVRERLESLKFAQTGASAIKWELSKSGFSFPSDRTINRVLKREGLVKKNCLCCQKW